MGWKIQTPTYFSIHSVFCFETGFVYPWLSWNYLCRPGWLQTDRDLPVSVTRVLGSKACSTTPGHGPRLPSLSMSGPPQSLTCFQHALPLVLEAWLVSSWFILWHIRGAHPFFHTLILLFFRYLMNLSAVPYYYSQWSKPLQWTSGNYWSFQLTIYESLLRHLLGSSKVKLLAAWGGDQAGFEGCFCKKTLLLCFLT